MEARGRNSRHRQPLAARRVSPPTGSGRIQSITAVIAEEGRDGEVRLYGKLSNDLIVIDKAFAKLGHPAVELHVCYEAGPCGFGLARHLARKKIACVVIAPSLIPKGSGDRIKTDRHDAPLGWFG